ncbi:hypothetical protein LTR37_015528 [Vermiconidia calcicola]|uniref:Uncharacterized protein n=1 Tax=Vermiconidia calcicola TaxID=1690605 RepID=A0ACC3MS97_9PEZI|nr:hypothetical protein LTR37_015528 [Vermiconidia calcicola]
MADPKFGSSVGYQSVTATPEMKTSEDAAMRPRIELGSHPQMAKKRSWIMTLVWQFFTILWLVPIVALLYLNLTDYVIGASAWCPTGNCYINTFNPTTSVPRRRAQEFDKESHDLLGGLQFVAKALEVWFGIIAAALIYLTTMRMAGQKEGLPIGYFTRPMEFADVLSLLDPLLWFTGPTPFGPRSQSEKRVGRRVWVLIALSVFLCVLINLMGPATAVLVIPALQWISTEDIGNRQFDHWNAGEPPVGNGWLKWATPSCEVTNFDAHNYSCTLDPFGFSLDSWLGTYQASPDGTSGYTTESSTNAVSLTFSVNQTYKSQESNSANALFKLIDGDTVFTDYVFWVPNRQTLTNMSIDYLAVMYLSIGLNESFSEDILDFNNYYHDPISSYVEYNKSLELTMRRNGPIAGTMATMWNDLNDQYHWVVEVDANRQIRCYSYYNLVWTPLAEGTSSGNYTKCIRVGQGWSTTNKQATFYAAETYNFATQKEEPGIDITVYSSDRAVFFPNGTLPSWVPPACLSNRPVLNNTICDWDKIFTTDPTSPIANRTENVNTIEFKTFDKTTRVALVVDFVAFSNFVTYTLNANPVANPLSVVQTSDLPTEGRSFPVDPYWYLAAWSVGEDGFLLANRSSTIMLQEVMRSMFSKPSADLVAGDFKRDYASILPIFQTLSILDYSTVVTDQTESAEPATKPMLKRNAEMYVWAYGLGSRTAHLGAFVAIAGCAVVLWYFFLAFVDRRHYRSPTQLVVAALEHAPRGEFDGRHHDEIEMARVRFHIRDNDAQVGKYSFYEPAEEDSHDEKR